MRAGRADTSHLRGNNRDSDASLCSSRPSISSLGTAGYGGPGGGRGAASTEPVNKQAAIRNVNAYLSSHNIPISLALKPLPSTKDITETLRFVASRLGFTVGKLEDDIPLLLKVLNCPFKLQKNVLKSAPPPHAFPPLIAVISWMVQIADYADHLSSDDGTGQCSLFQDDLVLAHALNSYIPFMQGDDDVLEELERQFVEQLEEGANSSLEKAKDFDRQISELEETLKGLKSGPSHREVLEKEREEREADMKKFHSYIGNLQDRIVSHEKELAERQREYSAKVEEKKRICEENEELKRRIEMQGINSRDAERMKRELQTAERETAECDNARSVWEEKCWDLDATMGQKFKELETLSVDCNQTLRRLKLECGFQYSVNAEGSSPAEVLGIDYKSKLKPAIKSFSDEIKKNSMKNLEDSIVLQQQVAESNSKIEAKKNQITALQSHLGELEAQLNLIRKEIQDYSSRCEAEAKQLTDDLEVELHGTESMEKQAIDALKASELKLRETMKQSEEEIQMCAYELFALIDAVSRYKEYMESKISEMKKDLIEAAEFIASTHKSTFS